MAIKGISLRIGWMVICTAAVILAAIVYAEGQALKEATTVVSSIGQLATMFILLFAFWVSIGVALVSAVKLIRR